MTRRELGPLFVALVLIAGIGAMVVHSRQARVDREARIAAARTIALADADPLDDGSGADRRAQGTIAPSDLGALPLRVAALPAPTRDIEAIRRDLALRGPGTYIADLLAADSVLVRWPDRTVAALRVWVQPFAEVPNWSDTYPQMVRDVFPEWSAAGFPLHFLHVVDSASADLHVLFTRSLPGRQIGLTSRLRDVNGWIVGATITVGTEDETGEAFPPALIAGIARHEVGHALGLGHASDPSAVMYPESQTTTIGAADRATLHLLYTLPPGSVR